MNQTSYGTWMDFPGWTRSEPFVKDYLTGSGFRDVLELGSGANPTLKEDFLALHPDITYTTNDLDAEELAKASDRYQTLLVDFTQPNLTIEGRYDLIFSKMVNEHVRSGEDYYRNIFRALKPGGSTFHLFSTLYAFPFMVNRIVPEAVSSRLLSIFRPRDEFHHAKFKAYYSWSRGPMKRSIKKFESIGFEVVRYNGYFGHSYYIKKLGLLHKLEVMKARTLAKYPIPALTSYSFVELKRPL